jgi:hypothetical protein
MSERNYMTLQLTLPALEKLMADTGPEFVLQLKQAVIEEFARRRIKALQDDDTQALVTAEVTKQIGVVKRTWPQVSVELRPEFRSIIQEEVTKAVAEQKAKFMLSIRETVNQEFERFKDQISGLVESSIRRETKSVIDTEVKARLQAALSAAGV